MARRVITLLVVVAVLVAVTPALAASGGSPRAVGAAHRRAAVATADHLLGEVAVPSGAIRVSSEPAGSQHMLDRADGNIFLAALVQRTAFWTTDASPEAAIAAVHAPPGWRVDTGGDSPGQFDSVSLVPDHVAPLVPRELTVTAVALRGGATGIRADAQVAYVAPRLPAQRVPAAARVLDVDVTAAGGRPARSLTVTRGSAIRRIAAAIDALPFGGHWNGVAISCPAMPVAQIVTFTFRGSAGGPVLAQLSEPADAPSGLDPCVTATVTIRGHHEPPLMAGGRLLHLAAAVLGIRLARPA